MDTHEHTLEDLFEQAVEYGQTRMELAALKTVDKVSDAVSSAVSYTAAVMLLGLAFLILSIGLALLVGDALGKSYYGFFALAGFYAIAGIFFFLLRHTFIKTMVGNAIISHSFK
jgi:hypothetical protein